MEWHQHFSARMARMQASEIRELLKLLDQPDIISFAGGIPDSKLFPVEEIARACQEILSEPKRAASALQYAVSEGYLPLRQWIAERMTRDGVICTPDHILITNGSQQALDFLGKLFISSGDTVLTASPTYLGALQAFNAYEPVYDVLPVPGSNRSPQSYIGSNSAKPKFAYVMPEFQNPTGTTLTLDERNALLDFTTSLDVPLIEDNAYDALRYDGEVLPSLTALAIKRAGSIDKTRAIYCGTFSKSIVPALRIGWIVAPKAVIEKLVLINQASDLHVSPFNQMLMFEVASRIIDSHTQKVRAVYQGRRDAMLQALEKHMPKTVTWTKPQGGMFVWVTLPPAIDGAKLLERAIKTARVAFVPGSAFHPDGSGKNTLRLSFSLNEPEMIAAGIERLARLINEA